jgi:hydrogenase maturation protease
MPYPSQDAVADVLRSAALVVCVGNELIADDAIGYEVYTRLLSMDLPSNARIEFAGVGGLALLDYLTGEERAMIVVDAVQLGADPGTIHCLPWDAIPSCGNAPISAHGIGLKETIDIGNILYPDLIPPAILLVGIEGRCFNRMRDAMTPATAAAADKAAEYIRRQLFTYLEEH